MKRPRTTAKSPLDIVLLHFPEVRQGTIIGRCGVSGQSGSIIWYIRMPDASYCKVQIGLNQKPSKTPLDPDLADHLEAVWQGMGDAALGEESEGWKWSSFEFTEIAEDAIVEAEGLP
jgi:hypothetical protein